MRFGEANAGSHNRDACNRGGSATIVSVVIVIQRETGGFRRVRLVVIRDPLIDSQKELWYVWTFCCTRPTEVRNACRRRLSTEDGKQPRPQALERDKELRRDALPQRSHKPGISVN